MINKVHKDAIIGIKRLSDADLGTGSTSNQTHIGLFEKTLSFLKHNNQTVSSQLIYKKRVYDSLSLLDYIEREDGKVDAPKIRKGNDYELYIGDKQLNSVVREIRDIVKAATSNTWYLMWLGLDTEELVFLLFENGSLDYEEVTQIVGNIGVRKQIDDSDIGFRKLVSYINNKVQILNIEYYEELEVASQTTEEIITKRKIPRIRDIAKANELFNETGLKGEEILAQYFENQKSEGKIKDFLWLNRSKETGMPYDFEVTTLENTLFFSDAKSTSYKFELPIILSSAELSFINENKTNYLIHRLYTINDSPKMRVCENIYRVSDAFLPKFTRFNKSLLDDKLKLGSAKVSVPTELEMLNFQNEIIL
jgi:hypothetical protein